MTFKALMCPADFLITRDVVSVLSSRSRDGLRYVMVINVNNQHQCLYFVIIFSSIITFYNATVMQRVAILKISAKNSK